MKHNPDRIRDKSLPHLNAHWNATPAERMSELADRLKSVYEQLTPGAIDSADLDGMAFTVRDTIAALRQAPGAEVSSLVSALEQARRDIINLAASGTDRIDELCKKLQKMDPSPIWPIPFPDPPERTWQPIVRQIDVALAKASR